LAQGKQERATVNKYDEWLTKLKGRDRRKLENNTYLELLEHPDGICLRLHATCVLFAHKDGTLEVDHGGWETVTSKDRINSYLPREWSVGSSSKRGKHRPSGWVWYFHHHDTGLEFNRGDKLKYTPQGYILEGYPLPIVEETPFDKDAVRRDIEEAMMSNRYTSGIIMSTGGQDYGHRFQFGYDVLLQLSNHPDDKVPFYVLFEIPSSIVPSNPRVTLRSKYKAFDPEFYVAEQATVTESLRTMWDSAVLKVMGKALSKEVVQDGYMYFTKFRNIIDIQNSILLWHFDARFEAISVLGNTFFATWQPKDEPYTLKMQYNFNDPGWGAMGVPKWVFSRIGNVTGNADSLAEATPDSPGVALWQGLITLGVNPETPLNLAGWDVSKVQDYVDSWNALGVDIEHGQLGGPIV
jgi:hypothetical protein